MPSVQFFGQTQIMNAAEARKCPGWAIFIGRSLFMKNEEKEMTASMQLLEQALEALKESGTEAIYTIKFFEHPDRGALKIKENTVCDGGSFNFKLIEPEEREGRQVGYFASTRLLEDRVKQLEAQLQEKDESEDEPETIGSIFIDLLKNPSDLAQLVNIGRGLLGMNVQPFQQIGNSSPIRAGQGATQGAVQETTQESVPAGDKLERLAAAIDTLEKEDPNLVDHLEKLATMAKNTPDKFRAIVSMLDLQL